MVVEGLAKISKGPWVAGMTLTANIKSADQKQVFHYHIAPNAMTIASIHFINLLPEMTAKAIGGSLNEEDKNKLRLLQPRIAPGPWGRGFRPEASKEVQMKNPRTGLMETRKQQINMEAYDLLDSNGDQIIHFHAKDHPNYEQDLEFIIKAKPFIESFL